MSPQTAARRPRIAALDALRGLAALVVVLHHARSIYPALDRALAAAAPAVHTAATAVTARNTEAVLLFFVLSGFCIRLAIEGRDPSTPAAIRAYLYRRALRILPLYWLALALSGAVAHAVAPVPEEALSALTLLGNLCFLQTAAGVPGQWVMPYAGNAALWSLSFEAFFYLAYPALAVAVRTPGRRTAAVFAVSALGYAVSAVAPNPIAMFCAASVLWYLGVDLAELHLRGRAPWPLAAYAAVFAFAVVPLKVLDAVAFHGVFVAFGLFLCGAGIARAGLRLPGALVEPCARIGAFSYGLYLVHVPILRAFAAVLGQSAVSACAGILASLVVAQALERGVAWVVQARLGVAAVRGGAAA